MTRTALWKEIAETLADEIARGHFPTGARLPTEAELSARFGVNRHTVRHALADLAARGLVHARRGAGVFVLGQAAEYPLGRRVRFHQAMEAGGRLPMKELTRREIRLADPDEAAALQLQAGAQVVVVEGLSSADGQPIAVFRSVFPAARFPGLLEAFAGETSITRALAACGLADYTRASTRVSARAAGAMVALALLLPEGAPVLRTTAVNVDAAGVPVEFGTTWFAGERVTLTVTPEGI
ncbi:phosphonate metabolism transcriptional regulator PhnF [Xinfangfangia sp. D13-10-4-6]|uniref:phosphonate metabolism transcriptional regulator PhnF n=1 Tax=Pseudogemmobacter hezensis TaxID=2737662 RepID=UPI001555C433|nr:phosphonate metabolism transcriptional regulator PhnF [Pseudogemmobacter hezensis]NPD14099.1 phosphonate metabolism transcriptional regulator PhnF [Pseudogemmobacter hezensis]